MPSTYTSRIRLDMQGTGDNSNTWGTALNTGVISITDDAIAGYAQISFAAANVTLTANNAAGDQARMAFLEPIGALTANVQMVIPSVSKGYWIKNSTTGAYAVSVGTLGATGVNIPQGGTTYVICNGSATAAAPDAFPGGIATPSAVSVGGTLTVTGATCLAGTSNHVGAATFGGAVSTNSTLQTTGAIGGAGAVSVGTTLDVTGATSLNSTLVGEGAATFLATLSVAGAATFGAAVSVNGNTVLEGTLDVTGAVSMDSTLVGEGAVTFLATLSVAGAAAFGGAVSVNGNTVLEGTLNVTGAVSLDSTMVVEGAATFLATASIASTLTVGGATSINGVTQLEGGARFGTNVTDVLDTYEEGSWTPVFAGGTDAGNYTLNVQVGRYIRTGDAVWIAGALGIATTGSIGTGNLTVTGLPFTATNVGNLRNGITLAVLSGVDLRTGYSYHSPYIDPNATIMNLAEHGDNVGAAAVTIGAYTSVAGLLFQFSGNYRTG